MSLLATTLFVAVSCLKDMPESLPGSVNWSPEAAFPLGEKSFGLNAISGFDTTLFDPDTITRLPEWTKKLEVVLEGTLDFNMASISDNLDKLNRILFRVNAYNGFPNQVSTQAYFMDAGMNPIDSMFIEGPMVVPPGTVEGAGKSIKPAHSQQDAVFEKERIQPLENATNIFFRANIAVSDLDSALIPFYPDYQFDVGIGAMLDLTLEF